MDIVILKNLIFAIAKSEYDLKMDLVELRIEHPEIFNGMFNFFKIVTTKTIKRTINKKIFRVMKTP